MTEKVLNSVQLDKALSTLEWFLTSSVYMTYVRKIVHILYIFKTGNDLMMYVELYFVIWKVKYQVLIKIKFLPYYHRSLLSVKVVIGLLKHKNDLIFM
jgi:hypothetical protein